MSPPSEPFQLICRTLRREWWAQFLASGGLTLTGSAMVFFFFQYQVILTILGLVLAVWGLRLSLRMNRFKRLKDMPLYQTLVWRPQTIVWVYGVVTQRMPFGFEFVRSGLIYFKLIDGTELTLSMPEKHIPRILDYLSGRLAHATFGYTRDREQWYMAAPELLIRHPEEE